MMLSLKSVSSGLVWYWSTDLLGYSYILNSDDADMWALTVRSSTHGADVVQASVTLPSSPRSNLRIMPFFYCARDDPSVVVMGTGGVGGLRRDDLAVELLALSATPINRLYNSATSTNRCFCCEYMTRLHSRVHSELDSAPKTVRRLQLSEQFQQTVKGR